MKMLVQSEILTHQGHQNEWYGRVGQPFSSKPEKYQPEKISSLRHNTSYRPQAKHRGNCEKETFKCPQQTRYKAYDGIQGLRTRT